MPLDLRPGTGLLSSPIRVALALTLACAALLLAAVARPQAAHAACGGSAVLSGSCFEGGDGNLTDRKSTRLNSSHIQKSRMPSSA